MHHPLERMLESGRHGERSSHMRHGSEQMGPVSGTIMRALGMWFALLWLITCSGCALVALFVAETSFLWAGALLALGFAVITNIMNLFLGGFKAFFAGTRSTFMTVAMVAGLLFIAQQLLL